MIDLNKEAEIKPKDIQRIISSTDAQTASIEISKYVQAEKLKAQIEVLNKIGKKGSNPIDIVEEIFVLREQLTTLENENN